MEVRRVKPSLPGHDLRQLYPQCHPYWQAVPLQGGRGVSFIAFLESAKIGDQSATRNLVAHTYADICSEPHTGFGPSGLPSSRFWPK